MDREKLQAIQRRSCKLQMALAEDFGLTDYPCPAGECLLTDPGFARRIRDLVRFRPDFDLNDVNLLKVGRHFRLSARTKVTVGRNENENYRLQNLARDGDWLFEVKGCGSPVTILQGEPRNEELNLTAAITARYSDAKGDEIQVHCQTDHRALAKEILV